MSFSHLSFGTGTPAKGRTTLSFASSLSLRTLGGDDLLRTANRAKPEKAARRREEEASVLHVCLLFKTFNQ